MIGMTREEWEKAVALRKTKRNLAARQRRLAFKLRLNMSKFRSNPVLQTELRRVAALCLKLGERLDPGLAREVVADVMAS